MKIKGEFEFAGVSIPGHWIGSRFIATKYGWKLLRIAKCREAKELCQLNHFGCLLRATLESGELHHTDPRGRGMGGSRRNDVETKWACKPCHAVETEAKSGLRFSKESSGLCR